MAVQQNRKSRARRDQRRSHDALSKPTLSIDPTTGETHRRHHVTADGLLSRQKSSRSVIERDGASRRPIRPRVHSPLDDSQPVGPTT